MEFFVRGGYQQPRDLLALAQEVERLGFDGITLPDHLYYPVNPSVGYPETADGRPPFPLDASWPDAFGLIAAMAAVTDRLRLRTAVYILALRHPMVVARALGTAAIISRNRVDFGIGAGHMADEFTMLGTRFDQRGARTNEAIGVVRKLLGPGPVEHHGRFYDFGPVHTNPVPDQPVPIYVGGKSEPALRRAAELADGYLAFPTSVDEARVLLPRLAARRAEAAPDRPRLQMHLNTVGVTTVQDYVALADTGADAVSVALWGPFDMPPLATQVEMLSTFADEVIEPFRQARPPDR